ncbi:hypothetical protein JR316_0011054 [Psilocybe cubensis]|uniref:Uncharacterized protein n=2 Tax=Psilocybe cubensis TaxID=181762 RepID=A0ACB8GN48_PSICU|nr:hypothetical protein JR316_0011054 [Psilocybe cubensis]KAH9477138.1 hypothetical protein JR316_0011054 [Psilocybe cubensis]
MKTSDFFITITDKNNAAQEYLSLPVGLDPKALLKQVNPWDEKGEILALKLAYTTKTHPKPELKISNATKRMIYYAQNRLRDGKFSFVIQVSANTSSCAEFPKLMLILIMSQWPGYADHKISFSRSETPENIIWKCADQLRQFVQGNTQHNGGDLAFSIPKYGILPIEVYFGGFVVNAGQICLAIYCPKIMEEKRKKIASM